MSVAGAILALLMSMAVMMTGANAANAGDLLTGLRSFELQLPVSDGSGVKTVPNSKLLTYSDTYFFVRVDEVRGR